MLNFEHQAEKIRKFTLKKYGIGTEVPKRKLINDIKTILDVDYARAEVLLLRLISINYLKELQDLIKITDKSLNKIDKNDLNNSIII